MKLSKAAIGGRSGSTAVVVDAEKPGNDIARRRAIRSRIANRSGIGTALGHVGLHATDVEREASRAHDEPVGIALQRSHDHLRRADELSDANHGRVGEHRGRRDLQPFECLLPLRPCDRVEAKAR